MNGFIAYDRPANISTPYFEDSQDRRIPGRRTEKSIEKLEQEIRKLLDEHGAARIVFTPGEWPGPPKRYGWQVDFMLSGVPGQMQIAALPMRVPTPWKKEQSLKQALYLVRNWLESELWSSTYRPGSLPLIGYLMDDNGKTVHEMVTARLPLSTLVLPSGGAR